MQTKKITSRNFKLGQAVNAGGVTMWVCKHQGYKCLKYPGVMGWQVIRPADWNEVKPL